MLIYTNNKQLISNTWNIGYGNKLLHLYFVINLANKLGATPIVNCNSALDNIFDLSKIKKIDDVQHKALFIEKPPFPSLTILEKVLYKLKLFSLLDYAIEDVYIKSKEEFYREVQLLNENMFVSDGYINGHFWHYSLMPKIEVINKYIKINEKLINEVYKKYPSLITDENHVCVHIRQTDFNHHLKHIFRKSIVISDLYYFRAIDIIEEKLGNNITYHLFSDNIVKAKKLFSNKKIVVHNDNADLDWVAMHLSKSIIQSNSTFCWTASLHNKLNNIQPSGGLNCFYPEKGTIPFGFDMPFAHSISAV